MSKDITKCVSGKKDYESEHDGYESAMKLRDAMHEALVGQDYRRGYVSTDEQPGADFKPITTTTINYRPMDRKGREATVTQTLTDHKGSGKTMLTFEKEREENKFDAVPGR